MYAQTTANIHSLIGSSVQGQQSKQPVPGKSRNVQGEHYKKTKSGLIMVSPSDYNTTLMSQYSKIQKGSIASIGKPPQKKSTPNTVQ